jgi:glycopeptide antibiotics resistance protein
MSVGIFDIDDILLNFLGVIFGVLLNRIANKILKKNSIFLEGVDIQNH